GGGRADVADRQADQNSPQWTALGLLEVGQQVDGVAAEGAVLVDEERRLAQPVLVEVEELALVGDHALEQGRGRLVAEHLDVERAAASQREQPLAQLRRTALRVG